MTQNAKDSCLAGNVFLTPLPLFLSYALTSAMMVTPPLIRMTGIPATLPTNAFPYVETALSSQLNSVMMELVTKRGAMRLVQVLYQGGSVHQAT